MLLQVFGAVGYAFAGILYLVLAVLLVTALRGTVQSRLLLIAMLVCIAWTGLLIWQAFGGALGLHALFAVEILRYGAWLVFLVSVLSIAGGSVLTPALRLAAYAVPAALLAIGLLPLGIVRGPQSVFVSGSIVLCLIGFALIERIYGCADPAARRPIGYLCLAMAGIFGYDLVMFSSAVLFGQIEPGLLAARGFANALVMPFLVVAARRNREWPVNMFVSRQVTYFSVTFFGAGVYLLLVAIGGYYVKEFGGDWGTAAQAIILFGAVIALITMLLSDRLRRKAKVFFSKHFFSNRYDYREEWGDLTRALYHPDESRSLGERSIEAAARIFDSQSGVILLQREGRVFPVSPYAAWRREELVGINLDKDDPLLAYLEASTWVIDTHQYRDDPGLYGDLELPDWLAKNDKQQLVVPLLQEARLIGLLILEQETPISLTYEDTDLLKIVGRQVAGALYQLQASERLAEGKQFQAYSRLTAFLMHDLKNLAAQQSLVVKNAAKHKRNPEFVDDAFKTIEHSVKRMNGLIAQLAERDRKEKRKRIDAIAVLRAAIERVHDRQPTPRTNISDQPVYVSADKDRLFAIYLHVLRNAQDACDDAGQIDVSTGTDSAAIEITVEDTGVGMDDTFIREQLFRPFESTKGVDGMGIGAYQVREYVNELNGDLNYESDPGEGTTVTIRIPLSASGDQVAH